MEFSHVDNHFDNYFVYFKAKMVRCRGCGEFMLDTQYMYISGIEIIELRNKGVKVCTDDTGVCKQCQETGDYPRQCDICKHYKKYPSEFKYQATEYVRDSDADRVLICADCVANHPQKVITVLAASDDIETVSR